MLLAGLYYEVTTSTPGVLPMFLWKSILTLGQTVIRIPIDKGLVSIVYCLMAKQAGDIFIEGTIDDLTFYKMDGRYYVRMKSSLSSKKFWKSKSFEKSRLSCKRFNEGNKLASKLYRMIEEDKRSYPLFCFLKKKAILLLKEGKSLFEVERILIDYMVQFKLFEADEKVGKRKGGKQSFTVKASVANNSMIDLDLSLFIIALRFSYTFRPPRCCLDQGFSTNYCERVN